jgi:hypothetical protein
VRTIVIGVAPQSTLISNRDPPPQARGDVLKRYSVALAC